MSEPKSSNRARRRFLKISAALSGAAAAGFPMISRAQAKPIKIGMPTILSGRVAQLGISSRNALGTEVDKFNAAGGLGGLQGFREVDGPEGLGGWQEIPAAPEVLGQAPPVAGLPVVVSAWRRRGAATMGREDAGHTP